MTGFFFAMIAALLASLGARDQVTVARLTTSNGPHIGLLLIAVLCGGATSAAAAWAGSTIAPGMTPPARQFLTAIALGWAGLESLLMSPGKKPVEPTRSLGAAAVVLAAHQLTDAARFLVFALAILVHAPVAAAIGGAAGSALALGAAWAAPEPFERSQLRMVRRFIGLGLLAIALTLAARAIGLL